MIGTVSSHGRARRRFHSGWFSSTAFLFIAAVLVARSLRAAEAGPKAARFAAIPPCGDLVAAAEARKIPLSGIDPPGAPGVLNPGDSFTAIVTLCEKGGKRTQWLLYLSALPSATGPAPHKPRDPLVLYSARSNRFEFASSVAPVRLQTLGPFKGTSSKPAKAKDQSEDFTLDKGFLSLGLDRAVATVHRAVEAKEDGRFWFGREPPDAARVGEARRVAERLHLTLDEERALGGGIPALFSFFDVVQHTEGLEDILLKVIRKPSLWSVIKHVGVSVNLRIEVKDMVPADLAPWGSLSGSPIYYFPLTLELNAQPALKVTFAVTSPRPPLLACGGIIGMLAEKPDDTETYLTLRIVSARLGGPR